MKFIKGLGIFNNHYGYPEMDYLETYNGPTGKVVDIQGPQAHAGRNFFVPEGKEFSFDIDECPYLHIAIKAEEGTGTCLLLCVHDKEPREHIRRHVVIGKTPDGNAGIYDVIKDRFEIKDDGEWHEYDLDLRKIREKQDGTYPYYPDAGSVSIIQFYSWTGSGEHIFHFNDLLSKQESKPPLSEPQELSSLQEMLKTRLPDEASRLDATRIWLESRRNPGQFLARIKENSKLAPQADAILFTLEVADRVGGHPKVIRALEQRFDEGVFLEAGDIVKLEETEWENLIRRESIEVPGSFKKGDENASVSAFADHLRTTFERAYPKQAIRSHFDRNAASYTWGKSVSDILKADESLDPSIPVVRLDRKYPELFKEGGGQEARRGLAAFQRLHRLTGRLDPIKPLVDAGLTSARAIAQTDPAEFAIRFASAFGGRIDEARSAHKRAVRASSVAKLIYSTHSEEFKKEPVATMQWGRLTDEQSNALTTWRELFGSKDLGFCECAHCKSIFGPAAYLFDMLLFLNRYTAPPLTFFQDPLHDNSGHLVAVTSSVNWPWGTLHVPSRTLLDNFRSRRPDVPALELSCNNTNIEVPHIDLVNELLADLVARYIPGDSQSSTRSTTGTSEERRAWPEHEPPEAVLTELAKANRPWTLPYDYEQDRADNAREALPVDENAVIDAVWGFETLPAAQGQTSSNAYARSLAWHTLYLAEAEIELLSRMAVNSWKSPTVAALESAWGNEVVAALTSEKPPTVAAMERAGSFDFPALEDALETRFVRMALGGARIGIGPDNTCDPEKLVLIKVPYLFSWDEVADTEKVPGKEKYKLIYYLKDKFGLDWLDPVYVIIRQIDNGNTIKVKGPFVCPPFPQNYILIKLNDTKTKANLTISTDKRTSEFVAKLENSKINIYQVPFEDMPAILNRLYHFERVRIKTDWKANQLDNALCEIEQEQAGNKDNILIIGLLRYLQQRLQVGPDAVLCLFRNPSSERPFTLRKEKIVLSPFERLFGTEPVNLPDAADANAADIVVANIAARVGVGSDEVRFVLSKRYGGVDGTPFTDPMDILNASGPKEAWRAAVAGVFRVTTFAAALGMSITDFIALVELSNGTPLLRPGMRGTLSKQLINAVSFVSLAHDASNWPLSASEVLYLTTTDDFASRVHAPDAIKSGNLFKKLQAEVSRVSEAFKTAGGTVTKVQQVLSELLGEASTQRGDGQPVPEKAIDRIQRMIEWSSVFPGFKALVIASLPASAVLETEVQDPDTAELEKDAKEWKDVLDIEDKASVLPELLRRHLAQVSDATGVDESSREYQNVLQALQDETKATVCDPRLAYVSWFSGKIKPLLALMSVPPEELEVKSKALANALLAAATLKVSSRMEPVRTRATQRWLPALTAAALRSKLDTSVIQLLANVFSLDAAEARRLLSQLLRDPDHDQALLRAFVSRDGSTEQVEASLVQASYVNLEESSGSSSAGDAATATTAPSEVQLAVNRIEPSLQLDWAAFPPPAGINTERFHVTLSTSVATAALKKCSGNRRLVVESTGRVTMSLCAGYLFCWDEIPGNDDGRLLEFLAKKFGFDWVKTAKIEKIDDCRIIKVSSEDNYLSLKLNDEKTKVNIEIDNVRKDEFIASTENFELKIYRHGSQVLELNAGGLLQRQKWDEKAAKAFFAASSPYSDIEVRMVFTFATVPGATVRGSATVSAPQVLRVLVETEDREMVPLSTGMLTHALMLLDKAARLVRGLSLPPTTWSMLASLPGDRRINLNDLPITGGNSFDLWQKVVSITRIWKRNNDEANVAALHGIVTGSTVSVEVLARALGLARTELQDLLKFLKLPLKPDGTEVSPTMDWRTLDAALRLSDLARETGLPLAATAGWMTAPPRDSYHWALGALRTLRPREEWLEVMQHIHDPVREHLRDALVAWLVTHSRNGSKPFEKPESISDHLLTDVQMSACMASSRVQFGYAAVQRYIDAIRLGFEPGPQDAEAQERFEREWTWRRFYRLWEANRRVFAFPENWLEPDLRPDKTPFFHELEEQLMEGPLTTQSAENALADYLGKLVDVARPEIIGIIHESELPDEHSPLGFRDPDLHGTHVFGRSRSQPNQLYYRRRFPSTDHRWTPWERIDAELPGTHFIPAIAFRRLYLFSAQFGSGKAKSTNCTCGNGSAGIREDPRETGHVELSWIERQHGRWSSVRRGEPIEFDVSQVKYEGSNIDASSGFPINAFPYVTHIGTVLNSVSLEVMVTDGMNRNDTVTDPNYTYLKAYIITAIGPDIELGYLYGNPNITNFFDEQHAGWSNLDKRVFEFSNFSCAPSNIRGIKFEYRGQHPGEGVGDTWPGDSCEIAKVKCQFKIDSEDYDNSIVKDVSLKFPPSHKSKNYAPTYEFIWFTLREDPDKTYSYLTPEVKNYFESEIISSVWDPPPPEVYAFHLTKPSVESNSIVFHLTLQPDVGVCRRQQRRYRFREDGFLHFDGLGVTEIRRDWDRKPPDDWQYGVEGCIEQRTKSQYLRRIEIFSDGTVRPALQAEGDSNRGVYDGTTPWRQLFVGDQATPSGKFIFFISFERAVSTDQPYQIIVESEGNITSAMDRMILDEVSEKILGRTFFVEGVDSADPFYPKKRVFRVFWHPQAVGFLRLLQTYGVPRFLSHSAQTLVDPALADEKKNVDFFRTIYNPTPIVSTRVSTGNYPLADVDFSIKGAYSDYNWELFFHAPLLIAQRLSEAGQFEEAERWFKLLFDPARGRLNANPLESFQTRPLREAIVQRLEDMLHLLSDQEVRTEFAEQVDRLNRFPYQPHLIARSRLSAYQKTLVMKYLDHLIAWGDELFRRAYATDNRTELENAGSRYDLVARLLGKRPEVLPSRSKDSNFSFDALRKDKEELDLWDPLVRIEDYLSESAVVGGTGRPGQVIPDSGSVAGGMYRTAAGVPNDGEGIPEYLYFCVPHNDELLKYWDALADRLAKLRSCRDIEGVRRTLSLYGRRIDPGLLVRATAMGLDIDVLLGYLSAPLPRFRFGALLQRARGACDRAQAFGQALLAAIEKREAEELAKLRTKHEVSLLREAKRVRDEQVKESEESLEALRKSRESAEVRHRFYSTRKRLNTQESAESEALEHAAKSEQLAAAASAAAADRALLPNFPNSIEAGYQYPGTGFFRATHGVNYDFGGHLFSNIEQQKAAAANYLAGGYRAEAGRLARQAQYDRRWDDWQLQKELAEKDMVQIDRQIASAEIRVSIAEIERENQMLQIDQAVTVDAYLRDKFTNAKLYRWMESRMSRLYYQQYRLAYDLALKAQRALRYELGFEEESMLPDTWDPSRRGMEAASDLQHEMEKLETRYMDSWRREHEKQKTFSLADRRPLEFLELRQTGSCVIRILEHEFDEDEPGDYFRRIKQVSVSIPCVVGPDVSVNARLTLLRSEVRTKPHSTGNYARAEGLDGANDDRFRDYSGGTDHIVTSTGVNDTGQFDTGLGGDRLLPFEGAGVISTWQIDLPRETNHFDRASLADVKLRILYTARDGGDAARTAALAARDAYLKRAGREVLIPLAYSFSNAWIRFTGENTATRELKLEFREEHLPFALRGSELGGVNLYFEVAPEEKKQILVDTGTGTIDKPFDLNGLYRFTPKASVKLNTPLSLTLASGSAVPRRGWAVLIVKKTE